MAIHKKLRHDTDTAAKAFIESAAPIKTAERKTPVAMRLDPALLARIDAAARRAGISRNAWVSHQCARALDDQ